jgi:hypothetical protein
LKVDRLDELSKDHKQRDWIWRGNPGCDHAQTSIRNWLVNSRRRPTVREWLTGTPKLTGWDNEFDKFCDFLRATVFEFLPWLLRACGLLRSFVSEVLPDETQWKRLAEQYHRNSAITKREDAEPTLTGQPPAV